jgi:hypothetical protein
MANLDWSQCAAVESVPGKVSGAWVLKGTRMIEFAARSPDKEPSFAPQRNILFDQATRLPL